MRSGDRMTHDSSTTSIVGIDFSDRRKNRRATGAWSACFAPRVTRSSSGRSRRTTSKQRRCDLERARRAAGLRQRRARAPHWLADGPGQGHRGLPGNPRKRGQISGSGSAASYLPCPTRCLMFRGANRLKWLGRRSDRFMILTRSIQTKKGLSLGCVATPRKPLRWIYRRRLN
jgi:hypothetical protein